MTQNHRGPGARDIRWMVPTARHFRWIFPLVTLLAWHVPGESSQANAQSLWCKADPNRAFLFEDKQVRRVGDLITIILNEGTTVKNKDKRSLAKDAAANNKLGFDFAAGGDFGSSAGTIAEALDSESDRKFNGNTSYESDRNFADRITVVVRDVLPNGNLVVAGRRRVSVDGEERTLAVSGLVRYYDVRADNSVQSRLVSNLVVAYEANGVENKFLNQGWLSKAMNKVWPF